MTEHLGGYNNNTICLVSPAQHRLINALSLGVGSILSYKLISMTEIVKAYHNNQA